MNKPATPDEEPFLVERAQAGDERAFAELVEGCRPQVWSICWRITGRHADAEDALQDALTAAWQNLDRFRADSRFGSWLYRIASRASLAVVRRRREESTEPEDVWAVQRDVTADVDTRDLVQRALAQVPEVFRVALVLREYGDLSYEEIAVAQGVGVQTVKSRIHRARSALLATDGLRAGR